jgi:hypothetical protein
MVAVTVAWSVAATGCSSSSNPSTPGRDAGHDSTVSQVTWTAGDGGVCLGPSGGFASVTCDPSDEQAQGCYGGIDSGCSYSPLCGDLTTCQPFITNPPLNADGGVETFRMRLVNITAPPKLTEPLFQALVITYAVDLPPTPDAGGAACGENGQGYMNWLLTLDKSKGTLVTGGAPPSVDPFGTGYCYEQGKVGAYQVAPVTLQTTFTGSTFDTNPATSQLNIPIFLPGGVAVLLPIRGGTFHDVTVSNDGNCIGSINSNAAYVQDGVCQDTEPAGPDSCARWHAGGTFGGYITLKDADDVFVFSQHESLCVLLLGTSWGDDAGANEAGLPREKKCTPGAFSQGDYSSTQLKACSSGDDCDSVWLSVQFAASAVKITDGPGVSLCHGGTVAVDDAG